MAAPARSGAVIALAVAIAAVVAAGGCSKEDLSDASFVSGLRVLGVEAQPPEAKPGDTVMLTAWAVDPKSAAVDVSWSACLLPSNGVANPGCTDGTGNGLVGLGSGLVLSAVVPDVDAATVGAPDATDGVYLPIVVHASAPGEDPIDAVYRLRVRLAARVPPGCTLDPPWPLGCQPNQNPVLTGIDPLTDSDAPIPTHKGAVWALLATYTQDSSEEYEIPNSPNPDVFERLTTQWFATAGSFPDAPVGGTGVQKLTIDRALPPAGGTIDLWVVGHDERGGTAMLHHVFVMQ